ncbi:TetR/AcrR family transcriptional regulator [Lentilactobacillus hilgardii]|uniref:TetR/AcrR family transcriptional regulator n=1 Tax=Lentilactobacillus hilgardii TaxID=1588 RepID=UPI0021C47775|nr:TetR-like C-terminal domain-containing protein [Lentilactobacillus hilgardii]MCP9333784.1 TetR/AcrR family transcriptional regulator [Lentilactobacillus hilgardii]MCP9350363.1 TetR/AcrR family transcriptional regulator [Lentilactobacillus hilgardii]MCP9353259.1 TetR/AcrR family transcriptional regulator [Lentilactobacillus hilgardii]
MAVHQKVIQTERKIRSAFIYLAETKGVDRMTVSDITKYAKINRSTFYAHYQDKFAMIDHFENQILTDIQDLMKNNLTDTMTYQDLSSGKPQTYPVVDKIIQYIDREFNLIRVLLGPKGDGRLEERVKQVLTEIIDADLFRLKGEMGMTKQIPANFAHEIIVSGLMSIIKVWLSEGNPESPKEISEIIMKTRYMSPFDILGVEE